MKKMVCSECGGELIFEELGSYGRIRRINKDGTVSRRAKTKLYAMEGIESSYVYCVKCGNNKKFHYMVENGKAKIVLEENEAKWDA